MLLRRLTILATLALASAAPSRRDSCKAKQEPPLPTNGGERELAAPPAGSKLKHVVLGHGYQNYTCTPSADGTTFTSKATGALAVLYDVRPYFPTQSRNSLSLPDVFALATEAALTASVPLNLDPSSPTDGRIPGSAPCIDVSNPWIPPADVSLSGAGASPLKYAGHHLFNAAGVPVFEVGKDRFIAKKTDAIDAPASAAQGADSGKAVAWLLLDDAGGSKGIKQVYRVNTVGGSGHTCTGAGDDSAIYTAFYYMYG